jgi:aldehyde dehydrogenase (NAD+)
MIVPDASPTWSVEITPDLKIDTSKLLQRQRDFFVTGQTRPIEFRLAQLRKLQAAAIAHQDRIIAAVQKDLGRAPYEAYFELNMLEELKFALKHLRKWVKPQRVAAAMTVFPASAWVQATAFGSGVNHQPLELSVSKCFVAFGGGDRGGKLCHHQAF